MTATAVVTTDTAPDLTPEPFTAHDRCDRCGAQAYTEFEISATSSRLLFCAHHTKANELALMNYRMTRDHRHLLEPTNRQQGISY